MCFTTTYQEVARVSVEIGAFLRQARESAGLSLDEVQEQTKIQKSFLIAIEDGDFDKLPSPFYVRTYLRSYATCVNVEPHHILRHYRKIEQGRRSEQRLGQKPISIQDTSPNHGDSGDRLDFQTFIENSGKFQELLQQEQEKQKAKEKTEENRPKVNRQTAISISSNSNVKGQTVSNNQLRSGSSDHSDNLHDTKVFRDQKSRSVSAEKSEVKKSLPGKKSGTFISKPKKAGLESRDDLQKTITNLKNPNVGLRASANSIPPKNQKESPSKQPRHQEENSVVPVSKQNEALEKTTQRNKDRKRSENRLPGIRKVASRRNSSKDHTKKVPAISRRSETGYRRRSDRHSQTSPPVSRKEAYASKSAVGDDLIKDEPIYKKRWFQVAVAGIIIIPLLGYLIFAGGGDENNTAKSDEAPQETEVPAEIPSVSQSDEEPTSDESDNKLEMVREGVYKTGADKVEIVVSKPIGLCNITIQVPNEKAYDATLRENNPPVTKEYSLEQGEEVTITLGRPENIQQITVNGEEVKPGGQIIRIQKK